MLSGPCPVSALRQGLAWQRVACGAVDGRLYAHLADQGCLTLQPRVLQLHRYLQASTVHRSDYA